ncbi:probable Rho GTPase-activating protein CG5521 isoform X2 [Condylostylus longicornis]|uniref:probable Rho GTPase-activating protein CG5521 isoform X2 n=1 Tax=Condylostylus longicornis TaxID=2530218 RepID=UPI00244DB353|nr:probable Rho GTPase-activating protein CG5521 isoform X2 [Condylostylus longicornis]
MFTKKSHADVKKSTLKIQDYKKDSATRLRHLKTILDFVDLDEAKSVFETNYSHVYYILYDTFVQAEANLKQRVHKAHKEELEGSLWLLGKILCLLPELLARRWQCHSLSLIIGKLLHPGNSAKLRKEGVKYFLLWYQALGRNAPPYVHSMFSELVPGLIIPQKGLSGPSSEVEFNTPDFLSHPNMKGELGGSVFHDNCVHPVQCGEKGPLLPPSSNERSAPDPRDGLDILLTSMVHTTACLKWREQSTQRHMKCFEFLLERFKEVYLTVFCPHFDIRTSIYEPKLDLPLIRTTSKKDEVMSSCIVVLINWLSRFTHEKLLNSRLEHVQIEEEEYSTLLANPRFMAYAQGIIVRDVLYMSRENVNFVHEVYRQAFLLGFSTKSQIEAIRTCIAVYRDWMTGQPPPPFLLEPTEEFINRKSTENGTAVNQRLRTDSYLGAISKENYSVRAGLQNVLQVFVTNASNVFLINTAHLNIVFPSKSRDYRSSPLNEQTDICKKVLNVYRTMVMNTRMEPRTWEQLLLVLLQITSVILSQPPQSKSASLGGRLGQAIFQTLIVTWIRAHTNVPVSPQLWDKFLGVLTNLTYRDELIIEWDKTMQTLTRVLARYVYNLNLQDLPLDRLAESKGKRRRFGSVWQSTGNSRDARTVAADNRKPDEDSQIRDENSAGVPSLQSQHSVPGRSAPGTPALNRSYSEGSLASTVMHGNRKNRLHKHRMKHSSKVPTLSSSVEHSLNLILAQNNSETDFSVSVETLSTNKESQSCVRKSTLENRRETFRRAMSLDSLHIKKTANCENELNVDDENESVHGSRSPSPTASSGIEGGSIKDSPIQIDCLAVDNSSVDTQEDIGNSLDRRSIISGGTATGWLPDSAAIMWKRMLGSLGDVNKIPKSELHAQVFKHLVDMTINLIKIKQNQGISHDNQSTPAPPSLVPPIGIVSPWCYGALKLDSQFKKGKLWAVQLLCMLVVNGSITTISQLSLFYNVLHKLLTGEDRDMIYVILKYLEGPRFLSILLPGHTLLYLDIVHASAILLTSFETGRHTPRAEVASLLGSLLCYPASVIPKPVLQPSEKIELMECPDLQNHVLNIILRCARREPSSKARCIALAQLGQWILQKLSGPLLTKKGFLQNIPHKANSPVRESRHFNPRIKEVVLVLLQALQFKHRTIAIAACNSLKICAERAKELAYIERLPHLIIKAICKALEIQNVSNPKEADKTVITSLILCLGEFCMAFPSDLLTQSTDENDDILILTVLKTLHVIASGSRNDRIKLLTADEDFDMTILCDDVDNEFKSSTEANYQTTETIQNCVQAIRLCAKGVAMHLFTHLGHFPMGIGASRLSSMVEEQDDVQLNLLQMTTNVTLQEERRDSVDLGAPQVLNAQNIQIFMLNNGLVSSFVELPALKLPGGGATAGLVTAEKQVRVLLRDLNGKACWDASILYSEPKGSRVTNNLNNAGAMPIDSAYGHFQIGSNFNSKMMPNSSVPLDPLVSTMVGMEISVPRHTLRHRPPNELPLAKDIAPDLDQLDDLLQYIGHTSPECLSGTTTNLNMPGPSPLGAPTEAQAISIILNQRTVEQEYVQRQNQNLLLQRERLPSFQGSVSGGVPDGASLSSLSFESYNTSVGSLSKNDVAFQYCRLLFSHLGLAGWERRQHTYLLKRTEKLLRELRNVDLQKCRETHKMAVIYVGGGQEDKNSILRNSCGSSTYEMFVSALGWEIELETHNGFLGGLPRQGCGATAPYYATPFLEVIFHVATRMPTDSPEAILTKTRHLGNDEVHIVWSEHHREYRRDILPTEFCDVLIVIYPLKSGLFRITVNRKPDVPWFGPLADESVISGACLASLVRATAINAGRAKRSSLPFYQQFYEERNRSLEAVSSRYKDSTTFEEFVARIYSPIPSTQSLGGNNAPLAAALIDHHRSSLKGWLQNSDANMKDITQNQMMANSSQNSSASVDIPSPRPSRKLHPFKSMPKKSLQQGGTPPESPTLPGRKFK